MNVRLPVTESSWRVYTRFLLLGLHPRRLEKEKEECGEEEVVTAKIKMQQEEEDFTFEMRKGEIRIKGGRTVSHISI